MAQPQPGQALEPASWPSDGSEGEGRERPDSPGGGKRALHCVKVCLASTTKRRWAPVSARANLTVIEPNNPISERAALKRRVAPVEVQKISITGGGKHGNRVLAAAAAAAF